MSAARDQEAMTVEMNVPASGISPIDSRGAVHRLTMGVRRVARTHGESRRSSTPTTGAEGETP